MALTKPANNHQTDYLIEVLLFQVRNSVQIQKAGAEIGRKLLELNPPEKLAIATNSFSGSLKALEDQLRYLSEQRDMILTIGGTGIGPEDFVPEATLEVCERLLPGIPEMMRIHSATHTSKAWLSRYQCGFLGQRIILNLP